MAKRKHRWLTEPAAVDEFQGLFLIHTDEGTEVGGKIVSMEMDGRVIDLSDSHMEMDMRTKSVG